MGRPGQCIHCVLARQHPQDRDTYARHCHCAALNDAYAAGKRAGAAEMRDEAASCVRNTHEIRLLTPSEIGVLEDVEQAIHALPPPEGS